MSAAGGFDGIDVADEVGDGDVGCGEFLHVALVGGEIGDRSVVAVVSNFFTAAAADRSVGIVVDFATCQIGHVRIEKRRKRAQDAAFGLAAQTEQDEIVARENGVDDLRYDGIFVADDAGENQGIGIFAQACAEVVAQFVFHAPVFQTLFGKGTVAQFAQRARKTHNGNPRGQILFPIIRGLEIRRWSLRLAQGRLAPLLAVGEES